VTVWSFVASMADQPDTWHSKIREIFDYWRRIHPAADVLPGRRHFDPVDVPALLPNMRLIDVHREPLRFRYRLVGTRVVEAHDHDMTGRWLDDEHPEFRADTPLLREYRGVIEDRRPSHRRGRPVFGVNAEKYAAVERILLPFAQDGATVDLLLAFTVFLDQLGNEL